MPDRHPSRPRFWGIVLAAGASSRMGQPKALLASENGLPLAVRQAETLTHAGAEHTCVVIGHEADTLQQRLHYFGLTTAINSRWQEGRLSSFQAGLALVPPGLGVVVLPVDVAGILAETLAALAAAGQHSNGRCVRACWREQPGHVRWLAPSLIAEILSLPTAPDFRMDQWLATHEQHLAVDDPAILNNLNTPEDWQAFCRLGS